MEGNTITTLTGALVAALGLALVNYRSKAGSSTQGKVKRKKKSYKRVPLSHMPELQNDIILRIARGERVERAGVWVMRQAGRYLPEFMAVRKHYSFFEMCEDPEIASEVTIQPLERFKTLDAVIVFSDILVIPKAMGMDIKMVPGIGPLFPEPLKTPADLEKLILKPDVDATLGHVFDAVNLTRVKAAGRVPVIGFAGAPFTLINYMIEGRGSKNLIQVKTWMYTYPEATHSLLQAITDIIVEYLVKKVEAGAQLLQVFESNAGNMSPAQFEEFSFPYLSQIVKRVKQELEEKNMNIVPMIVFARGANQEGVLEKLAEETQYDVVGVDWAISPKEARKRVNGAHASLQGNLDPCILFAPPHVIKHEAIKMLKDFDLVKHNGGLIANLGHGMLPTMNPDHLGVYIETVQKESKNMLQTNAV
jgi:uroporphyrinogen decarboxylase